MSQGLTERLRDLRVRMKEFIDGEVIPQEAVIAEGGDAADKALRRLMEEAKSRRLWALGHPVEVGGGGLSFMEFVYLNEIIGRSEFGTMAVGSLSHHDTVMWMRYATEEQKRTYLPKMANGEIIGCFGLTEPDYGSNPAGMITMAREQPDGSWVLNGAKMWITNGSTAQAAVVWAKTNGDKDERSIRGFVVPTNTPGFTARDQKGKLSLRASDTSELVLQDVHVPADAILPKSGGLKSPLMCLTQARYGIAWGSVGAAMACYDEAASYACNRVMFGKPIGAFQLQQARLAEMLTEIVKGQLLTLHLGRLKDAGTMTPQQVSLAKRNNVSMATDIAREARRLLGANGILAEYASMRHMANLESVYTYEGTHDVHTLVLGQAITGLSAFQ